MRVSALEQIVAQLSNVPRPIDESLSPNYLTINPTTGAIGAEFAGGIVMLENQTATFNPTAGISWLGADGNPKEYLNGYLVTGGIGTGDHVLQMYSNPDAFDVCGFAVSAQAAGGAGSASITAACLDSVEAGQSLLVLDSAGNSAFCQLAVAQQLQMQVGSTTVTVPTGFNAINFNLSTFWTHSHIACFVTITGGSGLNNITFTGSNNPSLTQGQLLAENTAGSQVVSISYISFGR